jgi:hypothetical protein
VLVGEGAEGGAAEDVLVVQPAAVGADLGRMEVGGVGARQRAQRAECA